VIAFEQVKSGQQTGQRAARARCRDDGRALDPALAQLRLISIAASTYPRQPTGVCPPTGMKYARFPQHDGVSRATHRTSRVDCSIVREDSSLCPNGTKCIRAPISFANSRLPSNFDGRRVK
jgi:hypothetical protein